MADLSYEVDSSHHATITLQGDIIPGDAERFERLAENVCRQHLDPELPSITAALDSPGGHYLEGLALGGTFRRLGYGTRVRSGADCYSAAAFAFLGGAFLGAVGGWGPDRVVEVGAKIGFHSFYTAAGDPVALGEGIEHGKRLAMILADYATALRIDMRFIIESLKHGPDQLLMLKTVQHFRDLKVKVLRVAPVTELTVERAIVAANYVTNWKRPVSLEPQDGETMALVERLTANEYHRKMLSHLIAPDYCRGPITELIKATIRADSPAEITELFEDAKRLNAQVMGNDLVDVCQGHGRKFLGDFLSRRSGTESGHNRIQRHTGAAHADGSVRVGEQGAADRYHRRPIFLIARFIVSTETDFAGFGTMRFSVRMSRAIDRSRTTP